ncbi:MAG: hypothetical protein ACHQIM_20080 [Sphingobacteriales bacterium]
MSNNLDAAIPPLVPTIVGMCAYAKGVRGMFLTELITVHYKEDIAKLEIKMAENKAELIKWIHLLGRPGSHHYCHCEIIFALVTKVSHISKMCGTYYP